MLAASSPLIARSPGARSVPPLLAAPVAVLLMWVGMAFGAAVAAGLVTLALALAPECAASTSATLDWRLWRPPEVSDCELLRRVSRLPRALVSATVALGAFGGVFAVFGAWLAWFERQSWRALGFGPRGALRFWRGGAIGGLGFTATLALAALIGGVEPATAYPDHRGAAALVGVGLFLLGFCVQGSAEEVVFRGWLLPTVARHWGPWPAIGLSSGLFAAIHGLNPNLNPIAVVNLALFGAVMGVWAWREGSIWGVCGCHALWNWTQANVFGQAVSGIVMPGGALAPLTLTGPSWLTGGAFGPEGGLAWTFALAIGLIALLVGGRGGQTRSFNR